MTDTELLKLIFDKVGEVEKLSQAQAVFRGSAEERLRNTDQTIERLGHQVEELKKLEERKYDLISEHLREQGAFNAMVQAKLPQIDENTKRVDTLEVHMLNEMKSMEAKFNDKFDEQIGGLDQKVNLRLDIMNNKFSKFEKEFQAEQNRKRGIAWAFGIFWTLATGLSAWFALR